MNDDCEQCREWEICPFHSKEEEFSEVELRVTLNGVPMSDDEVATVRSTGIVRVSSPDGKKVLTYDNGRLINEEPAEVYTDWGMGCGCNSCVRLWANVRAFTQRGGSRG